MQVSGRLGVGGRVGASGKDLSKIPFKFGDLPPGRVGETDWLGNITIQRGLKGPEFERALLHEAGHRTLSPTSGPMWLRKFRGEVVGATANQKSQLVRYLDEVYAERRAGASLGEALRYPFQHPEVYRVQKSRVIAEAVAYGTVVGGAAYVGWKIGE